MTEKSIEQMHAAARALRDDVLEAKAAQEKILDFFRRTIVDDSGKLNIFTDDIRGAYLAVDASWQMLYLTIEGGRKEEDATKCRAAISRASDLLDRAVSTLDSYRGNDNDSVEAKQLKSKFGFACKKAREGIAGLLDEVAPPPEVPPDAPPENRLKVNGPRDIELLCEVCGKWSMKFADGEILKDPGFIFYGTTKSVRIDEKRVEEIIDLLLKEELGKLHKIFKDLGWSTEDGLDGYCPDCDKTYCRGHMNVQEVWDEGFYDFSWGTCPEGHRRCIDD